MIFIAIFLSVIIISITLSVTNSYVEQVDKDAKFRQMTRKFREKYGEKYGECTLALNPHEYKVNNMDSVLIYDNAKIIAINHAVYNYSDILDFNINEDISYKTSTSTGSMIGRGVVGGVLLGGIGALAGANTANKKSVQETYAYRINIVVRNMSRPVITYTTIEPVHAQKMIAVLKNIIDYNEKIEK